MLTRPLQLQYAALCNPSYFNALQERNAIDARTNSKQVWTKKDL